MANDGRVEVVADERGFTPHAIRAKKGEALTLVVTKTTEATCTTKVVFPSLNASYELPTHQPVTVQVPTDAAGTVEFECQMAMYKSTISVE